MEQYKKLNNEPIEIEYVVNQNDDANEEKDLEPSFLFEGERYFLSEFVRTHNNPWIGGEWPDHIHGYEVMNYYNPLFIELVGGDAVNVYRKEKENDVLQNY